MRVVAILLVLLVLLAGCSEEPKSKVVAGPDGNAPSDDHQASGGHDAKNASQGSMPHNGTSQDEHNETTPNRAPNAVLVADATAGAAPFTVEFTINGTDLDDDVLSWGVDADGDGEVDAEGTELPTTLEFTYESDGAFLANLTVNDGNASSYAEVAITVDAAAPSPRGQTVDGTYLIAAEGCIAPAHETGEADLLSPAGGQLNDRVRIQFAVSIWTIGESYTAAFDFDQGYLYAMVGFFDSEDDLVGSKNTGTAPNFGDVEISGTVPVGAVKGVLLACGGPSAASVHYEV